MRTIRKSMSANYVRGVRIARRISRCGVRDAERMRMASNPAACAIVLPIKRPLTPQPALHTPHSAPN